MSRALSTNTDKPIVEDVTAAYKSLKLWNKMFISFSHRRSLWGGRRGVALLLGEKCHYVKADVSLEAQNRQKQPLRGPFAFAALNFVQRPETHCIYCFGCLGLFIYLVYCFTF